MSDYDAGGSGNGGGGVPSISALAAYLAIQNIYGDDNAQPGSSAGPSNANAPVANSIGTGGGDGGDNWHGGADILISGDRRFPYRSSDLYGYPGLFPDGFSPFTHHDWNACTNPTSTSEILGFHGDGATNVAQQLPTVEDEDDDDEEDDLHTGLESLTVSATPDGLASARLNRSQLYSLSSDSWLWARRELGIEHTMYREDAEDISAAPSTQDDADDVTPRHHWESKKPKPHEWWKH